MSGDDDIVLGLEGLAFERDTVREAGALASSLGARLRILHVTPIHVDPHMLMGFPGTSMSRTTAFDLDVVRSRCDEALSGIDVSIEYAFTVGDLLSTLEHAMTETPPNLAMISRPLTTSGRAIVQLARSTGVPLLIVSASSPKEGGVVAATDLSDPRLPVVHHARRLASSLRRRLTLVHNGEADARASLAQVEAVTLALGRDCQGLSVRLPNTAAAVLAAARLEAARVIAVGVRSRTWLRRWLSPSVATMVVARAQRSVLLVPIDDDDAMAPGPVVSAVLD